MNRHRRPPLALSGSERERGAVLPMALVFLILFATLTGLIFDFIHTGYAGTSALNGERNAVYAANGAVDAAINRVRNDAALGGVDSTAACDMSNVPVNNVLANVTCTPGAGSGQTIQTTQAPPFAILTTAPFTTTSPLTWSGNTPPNCVNVPAQPSELGVVQVQDSKLVTVTGNVYVNSDADSDVWANGCPQTTTAKHIVANGNVKQRASCHDIDPANDGYSWLCGATSTQAEPTPDPGLATNRDGPLGGAVDTDLDDPAIAQPNSWALPFNTAPPVQTVPSCPSGSIVAFDPGTYNDAAALTTLMNGTTCPGRVFWFKPGAYYFNFTNSGSHEWGINDGRARVIGGQPVNVTIGGTAIGPTPWMPSTATATGFSPAASATTIDATTANVQLGNIAVPSTAWNPTGATSANLLPANSTAVIDGASGSGTIDGPTNATANGLLSNASATTGVGWTPNSGTLGNSVRLNADGLSASTTVPNSGSRTISLGGYAMPATVPANATNIAVMLNVGHSEGTTNRVNTPTISIGGCTPSGMASFAKRTTTGTDSVAASNCFTTPASLNAIPTITYTVADSTNATAGTALLDGITLNVSYTVPPTNNTVSATLSGFSSGTPIPAGATINSVTMDVAHGEGSTTAVNAPTVALPGCTRTLTAQATVGTETQTLPAACFSVAQLNAGPSATFTVTHVTGSATPTTVSLDGIRLNIAYTSNGFANTATVNLSGYATNPATTIPDDATITSVRVRAVHSEDNTSLVGTPSVVITPAGGGSPCTVNLTKQTTLTPDSQDATSCFNLPVQINNGVGIQYRVAHCSGTANGCTNAGTNAHLDGIYLDVTYVSNPRLPWDPTDPTANPSVPGACRHDGDPFWTDGIQWVFGGDSRINMYSGQMELCDKPSLRHADPAQDQQEIVLFGVKSGAVAPAVWAPATATNTATPPDNGFNTNPNSALTIDANSASTTAFTATGSTRSMTLSGYMGAGAPIPTGSTNLSVSLAVAHNEGNTAAQGLVNAPTVTITPGDGSAACAPLTVTKTTATTTQNFADVMTTCLNTPAKINGATVKYSVVHSATAGTANPSLDGITLTVGYTPPGAGGGLNPQSGCITQTPYYNPADHSPAYNGACALIKITRPPLSQTPPPGDIRKLTMWGTAYAPSAALDLPVDLLPVPVFNRGVVARMLMMGYQVASSTQVPFTTTPLTDSRAQNRTATFTATIPGKPTKVVATVEFCDNGCAGQPAPAPGAPVSTVITSWKVTR